MGSVICADKHDPIEDEIFMYARVLRIAGAVSLSVCKDRESLKHW